MSTTPTLLVIAGTRPELIKQAPLLWAAQKSGDWSASLCFTGQHRDLGRQMIQDLDLDPAFDLDLMKPGQTPASFLAAAVESLQALLAKEKPSWIAVQGDTTTALAGALAGFYLRIPVLHVEAGLRTYNYDLPYPEEMHRTLIGRLAQAHAAPTEEARTALLKENIDPERILLAGNTGIDCLFHVVKDLAPATKTGRKKILVTLHRRESQGSVMRAMAEAVEKLARDFPELDIVLPVHPNPSVREVLETVLAGKKNVLLTQPLPYREFVREMAESYLILTDSGGIQEEAPALGVPVLVLRDVTERPEAVACGGALLTGCKAETIYETTARLLSFPEEYARMAVKRYPYGDGNAAAKMLKWLKDLPA